MALLRRLWSYPERAESWDVFKRAAQNPNATIAKAVIPSSESLWTHKARASLLELLAFLLAHPKIEVRLAALRYCSSPSSCDPEEVLRGRLFDLLKSLLREEVSNAAEALFTIYRSESQTAIIGEAFEALLNDRQTLSAIFFRSIFGIHTLVTSMFCPIHKLCLAFSKQTPSSLISV